MFPQADFRPWGARTTKHNHDNASLSNVVPVWLRERPKAEAPPFKLLQPGINLRILCTANAEAWWAHRSC